MAQLFLTSCGFLTDEIKQQFISSFSENRSEMNVCIITTASMELKEKNKYIQKAKNDFHEMGFSKVDFMDIEYDNPARLKTYEVLYIAGGNPFYLLHHMRKSGADEILKKMAQGNVVIVGVSAGVMVLGENIQIAEYFTSDINTVQLTDFTGLQLVKTSIFPHYDRNDLFIIETGETIEQRLQKFEETYQCHVLRLKDDEIAVMNG